MDEQETQTRQAGAAGQKDKRDRHGLIGQVLDGRVQIERVLGEGGMGIVYLGHQTNIDRKVAVKVLTPERADEDTVKRFKNEARAASRLSHPNTITVHDFGQWGDLLYIVMEFLEGEALQQALNREGRLEPTRVLRIMSQVLASLHEAHGQGIIHRDIKPDNIYLKRVGERSDFVKVLDFGVAKLGENIRGQTTLTQAGMIFGTPKYMSPEQATAKQLKPASDLYSCSVMMFECLTGVAPFQATDPVSILIQHVHEPPPKFADVAPDLVVPPELEALVQRGMSKKPEQRFDSAAEMQAAVDDLLLRLGGSMASGTVPAQSYGGQAYPGYPTGGAPAYTGGGQPYTGSGPAYPGPQTGGGQAYQQHPSGPAHPTGGQPYGQPTGGGQPYTPAPGQPYPQHPEQGHYPPPTGPTAGPPSGPSQGLQPAQHTGTWADQLGVTDSGRGQAPSLGGAFADLPPGSTITVHHPANKTLVIVVLLIGLGLLGGMGFLIYKLTSDPSVPPEVHDTVVADREVGETPMVPDAGPVVETDAVEAPDTTVTVSDAAVAEEPTIIVLAEVGTEEVAVPEADAGPSELADAIAMVEDIGAQEEVSAPVEDAADEAAPLATEEVAEEPPVVAVARTARVRFERTPENAELSFRGRDYERDGRDYIFNLEDGEELRISASAPHYQDATIRRDLTEGNEATTIRIRLERDQCDPHWGPVDPYVCD